MASAVALVHAAFDGTTVTMWTEYVYSQTVLGTVNTPHKNDRLISRCCSTDRLATQLVLLIYTQPEK